MTTCLQNCLGATISPVSHERVPQYISDAFPWHEAKTFCLPAAKEYILQCVHDDQYQLLTAAGTLACERRTRIPQEKAGCVCDWR